ncbi:hypothetical protein I6A84_05140 [Frankia sp. CNm7]|uniref:Uncharacterized protein n=1 Tax=Frankia nepalensis TaxID=1836974 RepID=A0A937UM85_9ACTN|nr:hypothetical protein [Frankia nepalensis]MBL7495530.1 hypothetical protein [Frankia nepalensis]MBL7509811.1 hypothetical protein [Frankia nepalensis]MBL7517524.1 hypothetical protein [Frankia nepalensis]MBL7626803.1 hypothetical protein [Frankia nepalensis]
MDEQSAGATGSRSTSRLVVDVVRALRGWVVIAAGVVLLLSCYLGVSAETEAGLQLPYLVSGGFGGLAAVLIGSALLIADRIESSRAGQVTAAQARLAEQVDDLHALVVAATQGAPAVPAPAAPSLAKPAAQEPAEPVVDDGSVYAVPGGRTFHRPGCDLLAGKAAQRVEASQVSGRGLSPCSVCAPVPVA